MGSLTKKDKTANSGLERARAIPPNTAPGTTATVEITINGAVSGNVYLGWQLCACSIRISNQPQTALNVTLKNKSTAGGGQIRFRTTYTGAAEDTLAITLPGNGTPVNFFIGGKFGSPSTDDQDNSLVAVETATNAGLTERTFMVRVRKNANNLTAGERDRFLDAIMELNLNGAEYQRYLDGHNNQADPEIHSRPAFLPWHRAFILDLERRMQVNHPSVSLPYWRFDQPAPNLFTPEFMGSKPVSLDRVVLTPANPLRNWSFGMVRNSDWNTTSQVPKIFDPNGDIDILTEAQTLALGNNGGNITFANFRRMEGNPHGVAHSSFKAGPIRSIGLATRDPLFYLLHCNVDRLWSRWQAANNLWSPSNPAAYSPQSGATIGDNPSDTMWPWNGDVNPPRPGFATGGQMPQLGFASKPSALVTVGETIDHIGKTQGNSTHFDYDDVPF